MGKFYVTITTGQKRPSRPKSMLWLLTVALVIRGTKSASPDLTLRHSLRILPGVYVREPRFRMALDNFRNLDLTQRTVHYYDLKFHSECRQISCPWHFSRPGYENANADEGPSYSFKLHCMRVTGQKPTTTTVHLHNRTDRWLL